MARPVSSLESHPQRDRIVSAMAAGRPLTEIAAWTDPPVHRAALNRFKSRAIAEHDERVKVAKSAIALSSRDLSGAEQEAVHRVALGIAADPFVSAVEQLRVDRARIKGKAETAGDLRTWVAADGNDIRALELHARLVNRLDTAPASGSNTFVLVPIAVPMAQALPVAPAVDAEWCEVTPGDSAGHQGE